MNYRKAITITVADGPEAYFYGRRLTASDNILVDPGDAVIWEYVGGEQVANIDIDEWEDAEGAHRGRKPSLDPDRFPVPRGGRVVTVVKTEAQTGGRHVWKVNGRYPAQGPGIIVCQPGRPCP